MNQEIFGLRYDFLYRHGHYMELYREQGIAQEELSSLQLRMLEANQVPNLLPLEVQEVDYRISLLYKITSKRMLTHVLKVEGMSKQQYVKLLYAIVSALEESKNYMLQEMGYVLKDNFIFIGTDWSDVYLTYVPLSYNSEEVPFLERLEKFIKQMAAKVKEEDQNAAMSWAESLSQIRDLPELKYKLLTLMDEPAEVKPEPIEQLRNHPEQQIEANKEVLKEVQKIPQKEASGERLKSLPEPFWNRNEDARPVMNDHLKKVESITTQTSFSFNALSQRIQIILLVVLLLITAFLWQNYLTYPSTASIRITSGLTILFADIWFVMKFMGIPWYKAGNSKQSPPLSPVFSQGELQLERKQEDPKPVIHPNINEHYQNLHKHTTLLSNSKPNATVFLGGMLKRSQGARLEVLNEGVKETLVLEKESFAIGRGDAEAKLDYVLEETGISRLHAEIFKDGDNYAIKDLGSTNGTFLNGEALVAYQDYPLQEGDVIRIVRKEMTFRII